MRKWRLQVRILPSAYIKLDMQKGTELTVPFWPLNSFRLAFVGCDLRVQLTPVVSLTKTMGYKPNDQSHAQENTSSDEQNHPDHTDVAVDRLNVVNVHLKIMPKHIA